MYLIEYIELNKDFVKSKKIKILYNNYNACKNCKSRNKYSSSKQTHKTVTKYGSEMQNVMTQNMKKHGYKDEYTKIKR